MRGHLALVILSPILNLNKMNAYTKLAKDTVETYLKTGKTIPLPDNLPKEFLTSRAGVFVSIYNGENLRGCIGTYLPTAPNLAEEIIQNAISAATEDYRFNPITKEELPELSYSIYVLDEPQEIKNLDELNPPKYGILVRSETGRSGLLLPNLPGINTKEEQLSAVCHKAGINLSKEKVTIFKFNATKHDS
jgi:AmmeMemoRadiSam system protein A